MPTLPSAIKQTVSVIRYTAGTRNTSTTVATGVVCSIQPLSYRAQIENQRLGVDADFQAMLQTPLTTLRLKDVIKAADKEYTVVDSRAFAGVHQLILKRREII